MPSSFLYAHKKVFSGVDTAQPFLVLCHKYLVPQACNIDCYGLYPKYYIAAVMITLGNPVKLDTESGGYWTVNPIFIGHLNKLNPTVILLYESVHSMSNIFII